MNFYNYFVTERFLNNTPYRKFSPKCKQHSKTRKKRELNVFLIRFLPYLYTVRICLNLITSKAFRAPIPREIGALENFANFTGKYLCWIHFFIKLYSCFSMIIVKFSRTPILQSPLKLTQRF